MADLALQQMDYLFFVYGFSFFALGGVSIYLARSSGNSAWQWLGYFGLLHGLKEWFDLLAMSLGDDLNRQWVRLIVLALSYFCLCVFGCYGGDSRKRHLIDWRWMAPLLLIGVATGCPWGVAGLNITVRYALGIPGGLLASIALLRIAAVSNVVGKRWLQGATAFFAAYLASTAMFVPMGPFFPATYFNHALFLSWFGIPVQLFRTVTAFGLAACLWRYMIACRSESASVYGFRRHSFYIHLLAASLVTVLILGWAVTNTAGQHASSEIQQYFSAYMCRPEAMPERADTWQQQIIEHRLVVISLTALVVLMLSGSLLSVQSFQDSSEHIIASERLYHCVVDNSPNWLQLLDDQGNCLTVNPHGLVKIGYTEKSILNTRYVDIWPPDSQPIVKEAFDKAIEGETVEFEADYVRPDGCKSTWYIVLSPAAHRQHQERRVVSIGMDITDHRLAEKELRRAKDAAESATQAKTEFLANMSHEIRTPITAILGYTDLLLEPHLPEEERQNYINTVRRNGMMLLDLINDILDISKIEAGKIEIEHIACSPWQVLSDMGAVMRLRADSKGLKLLIECDGPLPKTITTDPTLLRQILVNLVGNAVKFTEVGQIRVVARLLREEGHEPMLQFDVSDTGIGMTAAQLATIFRPFTQADSSTSRKYGGTGLGLTISKRLACSLGGDITVTSEPGLGSTFCLLVAAGNLDNVPLADHTAMQTTEKAPQPEQPPDVRCRVLLAEDGFDNQRLLSLLLKKAGAEVVIAQNGQEAYEIALASMPERNRRHDDHEKPFDVVLMDIQMPVMDGYEATRRLRQDGYTGPIIALSAHATTCAAHLCLEAGCNDYLAKPIDRAALLRKVAEYSHDKHTTMSNAAMLDAEVEVLKQG